MDPVAKPDARSTTSAENGKLGGIPPGTERSDRTTYDASELAKTAAATLLSGKSFQDPRLGDLTDKDRVSLARALKEPVEAFQARITSVFEEITEETCALIKQTLKEPVNSKTGFRADTLPSLAAIGIDKLQSLSGRTASIGSVHVQINNFNATDRSQVLGNLKSLRGDKQEAIAV